jgi:hypothetical protein
MARCLITGGPVFIVPIFLRPFSRKAMKSFADNYSTGAKDNIASFASHQVRFVDHNVSNIEVKAPVDASFILHLRRVL